MSNALRSIDAYYFIGFVFVYILYKLTYFVIGMYTKGEQREFPSDHVISSLRFARYAYTIYFIDRYISQ